MDLNLILSAQSLQLAPQIHESGMVDGLIVIKNVPARKYLKATPEEWFVLKRFEKSRTVPAVLGEAIRDRFCLPLGEFYELILKALHANILLEPGSHPPRVMAHNWTWMVRPKVLARPLIILFCMGLLMSVGFPPKLPSTLIDWTVGIALLSATLSFGNFLSATMVRGAGGEVYRPRWRWAAVPPQFAVEVTDAVMLARREEITVRLAVPAALATAAGIASWHEPSWAFFSLLGLAFSLRPIFGGTFAAVIKVGSKRGPSDAEHDFIFPPNRLPAERWRLLKRALSEPTTWARIGYGTVWTLAVLCWGARLGGNPPWTLAFWMINGTRIAVAIGGSLALLGTSYVSWEGFHLLRDSVRARRSSLRLWRRRWLGFKSIPLDEPSRVKLLTSSPLFSALPPPQRPEIARIMTIKRHGPWKALTEKGVLPSHASMIVSGKVSLRLEMPSGRTVQVQVLSEGDIIGLHDIADAKHPNYQARSVTPVTLLEIDRLSAEKLVVAKISQAALTDAILKVPFLRRIPLCQHWHQQAISRFALLSNIMSYPEGERILSEGRTVEEFYVIFQGDARVSRKDRQLATITAGEFFGEIGLMQNSLPSASVTARHDTRCLSIPRTELLRFVTHNYAVALELERVSSQRLGRPIFPLKAGDFRSI